MKLDRRNALKAASHGLLVIAHRGGAALRPENSLAAFLHAVSIGVDGIETDVKRTKDGHLVLLHADDLASVSTGRGLVNEHTLAEIQALDVGSHFDPVFRQERIPTLEEGLSAVKGQVQVLLDLKEGETYQADVIKTVRDCGMADQVVLGVRSPEALQEVRQLGPDMRSLSFGYPIDRAYALVKQGADIIRLWGDWVTKEEVERVQSMNKQVWIMAGAVAVQDAGKTTNDEVRWYQELGVDGIILDDPELALDVSTDP